MTKSMGLIVLFCLASWLPYIMYKCFEQICQFIENDCEINYRREYVKIGYFCLLCVYANSSINP